MQEDTVKTEEKQNGVGKHTGLIPFEKDDPRINRNGRPVGTKNFSTLFEKAIKKIAESQGTEDTEIEVDLVLKAIAEAKKGKFSYHKDIFDRVYGQALQKTEHELGEQALKVITGMKILEDGIGIQNKEQETTPSE